MRYFLAFAYNMHDSSVSIADEERVLLVLEAERVFREKKKRCDRNEMELLIRTALNYCGISIVDIDGVACTAYLNDHLREKERNVEWLGEADIEIVGRRYRSLVLNHHLAHAAMIHAFGGASKGDAVIDVCDGGGDFGRSHSIYRLRNRHIELLANRPVHDTFSTRFYDVVSRHLYRRIMCEGKLMALASLGNARSEMVAFLRGNLHVFNEAPEDAVSILAAAFPVEQYLSSAKAWDLAASAQSLIEDLRVESVAELPRDAPRVMLAGGATLNINANSRVKATLGDSRELLLPPCCDDTGQSLGALLYYCFEKANVPVKCDMPFLGYGDGIRDIFLGDSKRSDEVVSFLANGGIVFVHRGPSEIGPRALGHRSILAKPSRRNFDVINHVIKQREFYRPLAPMVPIEAVQKWFEWKSSSPYMLYAARVSDQSRLEAPGICHYDDSARLQTIDPASDPFLHRVLTDLGDATGCPLLINTSLNPRGAPILSQIDETRRFAHSLQGLGVRVFSGERLE